MQDVGICGERRKKALQTLGSLHWLPSLCTPLYTSFYSSQIYLVFKWKFRTSFCVINPFIILGKSHLFPDASLLPNFSEVYRGCGKHLSKEEAGIDLWIVDIEVQFHRRVKGCHRGSNEKAKCCPRNLQIESGLT